MFLTKLFWIAIFEIFCAVVPASPASAEDGAMVMNLCVILERDHYLLTANYDKLAAAIDLALAYAKDEVLLESGIVLNKTYRDGGRNCEVNNLSAAAAMQLFAGGLMCDAYLGPGCVNAAADISNIAAFNNAPVFATPAGGLTSSTVPRSLFPHLIRMSYRMSLVASVIIDCLKHLSMVHTFSIVDPTVRFHQLANEALFDTFRLNEPELLRYSYFRFLEVNDTEDIYREHLQKARSTARTILLFTNGKLTRQLLLLARDAGMCNGDYVYITVELFESESWGILDYRSDDGRNKEAREAFTSLLVISLVSGHTMYWDSFSASFAATARSTYNYSGTGPEDKGAFRMDPMVTAYFDSVVLYANALRRVQSIGQSLRNSSLVLGEMRDRTYTSPLTTEIIMNKDGDRLITYGMYEILFNGQFEAVTELNLTTGSVHYITNISWNGHPQPVDVPFCGYLGNDPKCTHKSRTGVIVGVVLALLGITFAIIAANLYIKRRKERDPYWWRISVEELDFRDGPPGTGPVLAQPQETGRAQSDSGLQARRQLGKAELHGVHLTVVQLPRQFCKPSGMLLKELNLVRHIHHGNLIRFVGICLDEQDFCLYLLEEVCEKGSLVDLMANDAVNLDDTFKQSFVKDAIEGMAYLHGSMLVSHGFFSSACCLVNSKFMLKIDDYGITLFRDPVDFLTPKISDTVDKEYGVYLWRAPELLRETMPIKGTQSRHRNAGNHLPIRSVPSSSEPGRSERPYPERTHHGSETRSDSSMSSQSAASACAPSMYELLQHCWEEEPEDRPTFAQLRDTLKKNRTGGKSIVDHLLERMEEYSNELELEVARKTDQFKAEKARSDNLLKNMLPKATAEALTRGDTIAPESFTSVTIFFSDIVGFADLCSRISPLAVLDTLNSLYHWSDTIMESYDVYKVEAISDIFMVASGLPIRNDNRHVTIMASLALQLRRDVGLIRIRNQSSADLQMRIGMHSGPCVAGIVGLKMPRYCLFGDSVNTASRMQSHGEANRIHMSESTAQLLREIGGFDVEERGEMQIKGKGLMTTYWLNGTRGPI
ncbi:Guanylate cyclase 32E [Hypsibius exemplaris]|uniref:guanylate cyclase n=1 Tax=Hypsibius exemplaris TaxID=2072580 RepID=A0A1W0WUU9_HYPEX|nr:Guanylate cyclase 32E [Hypsibius exemplaris]